MSLLQALEQGLFALGQVLRFPVMVLLWVCVASAVFMTGACAAAFLVRRRERRGFDVAAWLAGGPALSAVEGRRRALPPELASLLDAASRAQAAGALDDEGLAHLVLEREERQRRTLNPARTLVKVGPSLGLLGTLIPMGASLASLASGNLEAMAGQMVVAFTTTIIGLATGTVAYVVASIRQTWVTQTIREQRYLAERIAHELRQAA